jgi:MinD-like ATPase involved in chromosome partitioning or flagellar assembly
MLLGQKASAATSIDSQVIAICSPHGSTGKTTVATNMAIELARGGTKVLLIDLDRFGASVANHFALGEVGPGIASAHRLALQDRFDSQQQARLAPELPKSSLSVLTGLASPTKWLELNEQSITSVIEVARTEFTFVVLDLGSGLEPKESSVGDFNSSVLALADSAICVAIADPVGIYRLLSEERALLEVSAKPLLLVNRLRNSVLLHAKKEIQETLLRLSALSDPYFLPDDPSHLDLATKSGTPVATLTRSGVFGQALAVFIKSEILGRRGVLDSRVAKLG